MFYYSIFNVIFTLPQYPIVAIIVAVLAGLLRFSQYCCGYCCDSGIIVAVTPPIVAVIVAVFPGLLRFWLRFYHSGCGFACFGCGFSRKPALLSPCGAHPCPLRSIHFYHL
jgi:hypothetical protein